MELFAKLFDRELEKGIVLCVVPSHKAAGQNMSGIARTVRRAASNGRVDAVDLLIRLKTVDKLSGGGKRTTQVHYDSIVYNNEIDVAGKTVVLVDDITTTGNSLIACRNIILKKAKAKRCVMFALAQTDRSRYWGWSVIKGGNVNKTGELIGNICLTNPYKIYLAEKKRVCEEKDRIKSDYYDGRYKRFFDPEEDSFDNAGEFGELRLTYLKMHKRQEYWHLVLTGELENHLAFVQEGTEKCLRNYLDIFMEVFPISDCESSGERMFHLIFVSEMARMSAIRDMVFMSNGEGGCLESDIEELKQLKMLVRGNGSEDSSSLPLVASQGGDDGR